MSAGKSDDSGPIPVNVDNYVRAATSGQFESMSNMARGVNRFSHGRKPTPLDKQRVVRMNRDTIYSSALVDISQGATVTVPDGGGRYISVAVVNEDNYTMAIFHDAGTYELTIDQFETPFVALVARVLVDWTDPVDLEIANDLQNQFGVEAAAAQAYVRPNYDADSLESTHRLLQQLGAGLTDASFCNGRREEVRETRHMLTTAFGWGGLPEYEVVYEASTTALATADQQLTVRDVPVDGFWSLSVYNRDGYFEENEFNSYSVNNVIADPNADGSFTLNFGVAPNGRSNFLYVMDGWSYNVRLYQPRAEARDRSWRFPTPELVAPR